MTSRRSGNFVFAGLCGLVVLPGCETAPPAPAPSVGASAPVAAIAIPPDFLTTDYAALQRWLDERFEVEYRNMTPDLVFDQTPISDIRYETTNLPTGAERFFLRSSDMSRREILYKIAMFWDLDMTILDDANGIPSSVKVTGRAGSAPPVIPDAGGNLVP